MRKIAVVIVIALFSVAPSFGASGFDETGKTPGVRGADYVPGELLVKYTSSVLATAMECYQSQWGITTLRTFPRIRVQHLKLPKDMTVEEGLDLYRADPDVEYAEPNYYRYARATMPDDAEFGELWGLHNTGQQVNGTSGTADADIDAPEAWDITAGSSEVIIAVIDSGVDYNHPDLYDNIWINPDEIGANGTDEDGNGYVDDTTGWDFVDNDNDPMDPGEHGTHVAGTIAAKGNNAMGISGVCWTARIMPLRFLNGFGSGSTSDEISAIEYAIEKGAHIINASYGSSYSSQAEYDAISAANDAGILFVAAAGNDGTDNDSFLEHYPSSYTLDNIIAVAATNQDDTLASFSNYGATSVDVAAPGMNIYSCRPSRQTVWSDDFDDGSISDWTTGGTNNTWATTNSLSYSASYSLTDSPAGNYQNGTDSWARAPLINLSSYSGAMFEFKVRGISESLDRLSIESSSDGSSWTNQDILIDSTIFYTGVYGNYSVNWLSAAVDLGAYDGTSTVYVRFSFSTNFSNAYDGWYIDDVAVNAASSDYVGTEYQYMNGTSMATPHVVGLAALIKARYPSMSTTEIKAAIENTVDALSSLSGRVASGGRINAYSALASIEPPAAPSSLSASAASGSRIDLSWDDNAQQESGFEIERKTGSGGTYQQVATVADDITSYSDTGLSEVTTYTYRVRAYNGAGESDYSNEASATTYAATPGTVSAAAASESQIDLSWTDNSNVEVGFKIERKEGSAGTYSQVATVDANGTTYSDTELSESTTYFYRVRAYTDTGDSSYSNEANATTHPAAPSNASAAAASESQIDLSWTDNSSGESGFKVERKESGGSYAQIATVNQDITELTDTGLNEETTYYYRVCAYNAAGESDYSNEASATTASSSDDGGANPSEEGVSCFITTMKAGYGGI
jgi:subtilisin family serine protease